MKILGLFCLFFNAKWPNSCSKIWCEVGRRLEKSSSSSPRSVLDALRECDCHSYHLNNSHSCNCTDTAMTSTSDSCRVETTLSLTQSWYSSNGECFSVFAFRSLKMRRISWCLSVYNSPIRARVTRSYTKPTESDECVCVECCVGKIKF